ncbi:hypothetical protein A2V71_01680 [Candidatus Berkelbacteria bacterium RBG_13_40_8]|uniref:DNA 3'-5' helicase n=1 Tax=Candidatus Berkelbacteria bacterium RBG_13_40_8 TaxID=1797467 RepID=A0A1F5DQ07_9BACT|nr:MAG: hypothetical protein A2V71_01680 [Candidatus Berkelbacteria bacterium RBG_13_40_8]
MESSILKDLNPAQKEAVLTTEGPVLILAGAGSGKTKALTHRIAYLIKAKKVHPQNILAVTFTNKAAEEMKKRINNLLGGTASSWQDIHTIPWMGTFHSICAKILRREIQNLGYSRSFVIYDEEESLSAIKHAMDTINIDKKQYNPKTIKNFISGAKNELMTPKEYAKYSKGHFGEIVVRVYEQYQKDLKLANALDFDDLLMKTVELFENPPAGGPEILKRWQGLFRYILIDEYQDTNFAQYRLVSLLAERYKNICVVGDDFQCLPKGTKILTDKGEKEVQNINPADKVVSANGYGTITHGKVLRVVQKKYCGQVLTIKTRSGKKIQTDSKHILFCKLIPRASQFLVYLMFRKDKGYRIGLTRGVRYAKKNRELVNGLQVRANQERADRMWILEICDNLSEAKYFESYHSAKYGIPVSVFFNNGRQMKIDQKHIDLLFKNLDTVERAEKLFTELNLCRDFPHHRPQAVTLEFNDICQGRQFVTLNMFGEDRIGQQNPWHAHRVRITTTDPKLRQKFEDEGFATRMDKRSWRIETSRKNYTEALNLAEKLAKVQDLEIVKTARLSFDKGSFYFMPACNLKKGMIIPVFKNSKIIEDEIVSVESTANEGDFYDLDVENLHNYIANGVVVHNSIYGFRGANFRNILNFEKDYPKAKVIKMEQNYRSTRKIITAAQKVIEKNILRSAKELWTENEEGLPTTIFEAENEIDEVDFVKSEINALKHFHSYNDFVVLYRTNAQSRILEEIFLQNSVPYRLIGALRFYERKEIKDILAYLKLILNPDDKVSLKRIINTPPRGIGEKTYRNLDSENPKINKFMEMMENFRKLSKKIKLTELIDLISEGAGYKKFILDGTEEGEMRWENIEELKSVAQKYPSTSSGQALEEFLENVALVSDIDSYDRETSAVTMMTLHNAKGLEFPVVFMVGMEESLFPHINSMAEPQELEEERRLCYVGMTRAQKRLYLTHASSRMLYGAIQSNLPSRFISEIPEELIERI